MKKIIFCTLISLMFSSCELFVLDNVEEPAETIYGEVVDVLTGDPVLTDQGSEGIRVRLTELSWGDNVVPNDDFYCMLDGTYRNTKIFKGNYNIQVDGPFIPLVREDESGVPLADESVTTDIKGETYVRFEVQPFLKVEFVSIPQVSDGRISAMVKVTRAVSEDDFRAKVEPMGSYDESYVNMTDIQLFVGLSSTVGYRERDDRWSSSITYTGDEFDALFGQNISIKSASGQIIPSGYKVFVRAAARINYDTPVGSGTRRWNYSEIIEVDIP